MYKNSLNVFYKAINEVSMHDGELGMSKQEVFEYFCELAKHGKGSVLYNDIIEFADKNKIPYSRKELLSQCSSGALTLREKELLKAVNQ